MQIKWPDISNNQRMSQHQRDNVSLAIQKRVGVLCGSPGVGKTFCLAEIASSIIHQYGSDSLAVMCPTGKAAVRISESMFNSGVEVSARTIHSFLMRFNKNKLLPFSFILLDESSMIDTDTAAAFMQCCQVNCHILWTGDPHQLPPVGTGAPLRDLIAAGVAYGELTEIMRNSGGIVETCAAIRDQKGWSGGDNLQLVETNNNHRGEIEWILSDAESGMMDPVWDVQIVTAVNEKSQLGRVELNKKLQAFLNKQPGVDGVPFRVGDKLVNTKNATFKSLSLDDFDGELAEEHYVANGELAKVVSVSKSELILELEAPKRRIVAPLYSEGNTWELGYALSVHKSQGSDWPWVIVVIDDYPGAKMVCDRAWLYTAISRAKSKCFIVGEKRIADRMCRVSKIWHRKTFLKELILSGRARRALANV